MSGLEVWIQYLKHRELQVVYDVNSTYGGASGGVPIPGIGIRLNETQAYFKVSVHLWPFKIIDLIDISINI